MRLAARSQQQRANDAASTGNAEPTILLLLALTNHLQAIQPLDDQITRSLTDRGDVDFDGAPVQEERLDTSCHLIMPIFR
jgi:hypothetical protein